MTLFSYLGAHQILWVAHTYILCIEAVTSLMEAGQHVADVAPLLASRHLDAVVLVAELEALALEQV